MRKKGINKLPGLGLTTSWWWWSRYGVVVHDRG